MEINLNKFILPAFEEVFTKIVDCSADRVVLKGGRSSTKSVVLATDITVGCMQYKSSAVCLVKYSNKIEERLVNTFLFVMQNLGIRAYWKLRKSPFELVLLDRHGRETSCSIKFTGCDNPDSLKSYRARGDSFRYIWFEEVTDFNGISEVNNIIQTMARGVGKHCVLMSYNPPKSANNWVNEQFNQPCGQVLGYNSNTYMEKVKFSLNNVEYTQTQIIHHSSYLDVVNGGHTEWLGNSFITEAERAKKDNYDYYRWAYLGEVTGSQINVFRNICDWKYTEDLNVTNIHRGLDCSNGGQDPWAYVEVFYDRKNEAIYILNEKRLGGEATIKEVAKTVKNINIHNYEVYIDSAVPTFRRMLNSEGLNTLPAKKWQDSVKAGIQWLQSKTIYIDKIRTPNVYKELTQYEYKLDKKSGEVTSELPDENNHFIDAIRYALAFIIREN